MAEECPSDIGKFGLPDIIHNIPFYLLEMHVS